MFAVLKTGGKQYKVAKDDIFSVEKLAAEPGETVQFNEVLMLGGDNVTVGDPFVTGAAVQAQVLDQFKGPKTINFKKRRRKHSSQRKKGHRQHLTRVKITDILASGGDKSGVKVATGKAEAGAASAAPAPAAKAAPKAAPAPAGAAPKNLLDAPRGEADDLKKITGVGPKMVEALNAAGVHHFWQIAEWTPEDIAYMDEKLSSKGRIERDDWVAQASQFASEAK